MVNLHFAQVSDIHISARGDHDDLLSGQSANFLANICAELNQIEDLDFVLITGDLFDAANQQEFDRFQEVIKTLRKPYYVIPGNHDRRPLQSNDGLTRHDFAHCFNSQVEARPDSPAAQVGYWSIAINAGVQLIGLDSIRDEDWDGVVDGMQMQWLESELAACGDKLIILAIHHPLHKLSPIDDLPKWRKFVCNNGSEVLALLDRHPQVKVVLTGHHHLTKADRLNGRIHLACPAVAIYPCAYRTLRLSQGPDSSWQLEWQTYPATDANTISQARQQMRTAWIDVGFEPGFVEEQINLAVGNDADRHDLATWSD